jgi:hypothetical protein
MTTGSASMVSWWTGTSFAYYFSVLGPRMKRPSSAAFQYFGNETSDTSTTHLVAGTGDIVAVLRVVTVPGSRERVVEERVTTQARTDLPC